MFAHVCFLRYLLSCEKKVFEEEVSSTKRRGLSLTVCFQNVFLREMVWLWGELKVKMTNKFLHFSGGAMDCLEMSYFYQSSVYRDKI